MCWMTQRAPVHYVVDDAATTVSRAPPLPVVDTARHRYTMWLMTWRASAHYLVYDVASDRYTMWWMTRPHRRW
jgi:hypothetical protein